MLSPRKIKILEALINDYITTGEPIGSRTIEKKYNLGISSATIRNEMSELEDMGLITQPYPSAGRIPSDKGYRLYVDNLMQCRDLTPEEINYLKNVIVSNINHMEYLMQETAKAISVLTNYTTIVAEAEVEKFSIKYLQLMPYDEKSILLTFVTENKSVKNYVIKLDNPPNREMLIEISYVLNNIFQGLSIEEILNTQLQEINKDYSCNEKELNLIFESIKQVMKRENNTHIYTSGVNNILTFPEFSNLEKAQSIFKTFEEKDVLITLLDKNSNENLQIVIGAENSLEEMKDCSIIKADYKVNNKKLGSIGIIGPTRMDYAQVSSILNGIINNINNILISVNFDTDD